MNSAALDQSVLNPEQPLVTAVMITGRMLQWQVQLAVNCFENQTYPNRELVIINNAKTQYEAAGLDLILPMDKEKKRPIAHVIDTEQPMTAGMCRNYGISAASANILVQWDAHCWHSPHRIAQQLEGLSKHEAHICMLSCAMEYSYGSGYGTYWNNRKKLIPNSMMMLRPKDDDYAHIDKGEQVTLLVKLIRSGYKPIALDRPTLMCRMHYSEHGKMKKPVSFPDEPLSREHMKLLREVVKTQALG